MAPQFVKPYVKTNKNDAADAEAICEAFTRLSKRVPEILDKADDEVPGVFRALMQRLLDHLKDLDQQVGELERQIRTWSRSNALSCKLEKVPGIGPITATALVASIGAGKQFANGRQLAAWLRLVPRQHSTGGKSKLLGISKRGDCYLRSLLIHGARAVIKATDRKLTTVGRVVRLLDRRHKNVAGVALANKTARTVWALLAHEREFRSDYATA
jgi:transposase